MPPPSDYISGTINLTNGSVDFTGAGTGWIAADFREGDIILDIAGGGGRVAVVQSITSNTAGTLSKAWDGPTLTGAAYRIRYQWDSSRVSAQTRTMIEKLGNGNLESFSGVTGPGVVVMDGPHSVIVKPESDFINGVAYDVQVDTLAERDAYDGQSVGFSVLVSDIGDGRSAVYSKASNTTGDWTEPAYVTGPVGPLVTLDVGTTTTLPPGSDATVDIDPVFGGYELSFGIPEGRGARYVPGGYNPATAYDMDDAVLDNGSTWIALGPTAGNAPPTLPTTSNAYWSLLARAGTDGTGTGDVVGPAGGTVNNGFVLFANTTGKLIKTASAAAVTALLDVFTSGLKGLVPAPVTSSGRFLRDDATWAAIPPPDTLSVSVLALQVADNTNLPIYGPNWIADAFDTLSLVDVAGATNLDVSSPGIIKPSGTWVGSTSVFHFDGPNGSTTFNDSVASTGTFAAGASISTAQSKFGGSSLSLSGSGSYLSYDGSSKFAFGTGDFTLDLWFYSTPSPTNPVIVDFRDTTSAPLHLIYIDSSNRPVFYHNGAVRIQGTSVLAAGTWYHLALVRSLGVTRLYLNGAYEGPSYTDTNNYTVGANRPVFGANGNAPGSGLLTGYIDEIRIAKGFAAWTAPFTPPTNAYYPIPNNMAVRSTAISVSAAPVNIEAIIPIKEVDASVVVTDWTVEFSRNDGANWTPATMSELFGSPSPIPGIIFVRAFATVSAQPSGTNIRWRINTLTGKMIEFHGIKTDWN